MDILQVAQDYFLITFGMVFGIGMIQGSIIARGIRKRFPRLKIHARIVSIVLLLFLVVNMVFSTINFANPEKISFSEMDVPASTEEGMFLVIDILGLNAGVGTVVGTFVSITLILLFRSAELPTIFRYFVFVIGFVMLFVSIITRFTDYVPTFFQVVLYVFYQLGLTIGIFLVSKRRVSDVWNETQ